MNKLILRLYYLFIVIFIAKNTISFEYDYLQKKNSENSFEKVNSESDSLKLNKPLSMDEINNLRTEAKNMFYHGYNAYIKNAYPADELMPLSCKGRWRDSKVSRGDIDEVLGNFSLTLVDSLDTLVILGDLEEFDNSLKRIIKSVKFDHDIVVSVFETNIRMVGGLLSGHVLAEHLKQVYGAVNWYRGDLLVMAQDLATRLLPAFNTSTGIPHPKINLKYGMKSPKLGYSRDTTCTACAGTMLLEFAFLSRLTGEKIFEEKARQAMDYLWSQRHRGSNLVGTVLNVHNGDWIRRDSGVGAGIDSYYEYLLKGYVLFGDEMYLNRFNKHYDAVMKYISQGPMLLDVHMHRPHTTSKNFMDSLLAFWPGLQVLKGDIKPAIETHEMLYQVMQKHKFLPEAFTTDFEVHWGQHLLRPEFVESTYLLHEATGDPYYLNVGKEILKALQKHARVPCGFAAVKDVRTGDLEDRMDSFVLAETFKYLYLLFTDKNDLLIDLDDFVFTTEAHLLPINLARLSNLTVVPLADAQEEPPLDKNVENSRSCPNIYYLLPGRRNFAEKIRTKLKNFVNNVCPGRKSFKRRLTAAEFKPGNARHMELLKDMGVAIMTLPDGRVQLLHTSANSKSSIDSEEGLLFMQEMIELSKVQQEQPENPPKMVTFRRKTKYAQKRDFLKVMEATKILAGPAQFGPELNYNFEISGVTVLSRPYPACNLIENGGEMRDKIVVIERGSCMFVEKIRKVESFGAIGAIVIDNTAGSSIKSSPMFAMSGDENDNVTIPAVFLYQDDARLLIEAVKSEPNITVTLSAYKNDEPVMGTVEIIEKIEIDETTTDFQVKSAINKFKKKENKEGLRDERKESKMLEINFKKLVVAENLEEVIDSLTSFVLARLSENKSISSYNFNRESKSKKHQQNFSMQHSKVSSKYSYGDVNSHSIVSEIYFILAFKQNSYPFLFKTIFKSYFNTFINILHLASKIEHKSNSVNVLLSKLSSIVSLIETNNFESIETQIKIEDGLFNDSSLISPSNKFSALSRSQFDHENAKDYFELLTTILRDKIDELKIKLNFGAKISRETANLGETRLMKKDEEGANEKGSIARP